MTGVVSAPEVDPQLESLLRTAKSRAALPLAARDRLVEAASAALLLATIVALALWVPSTREPSIETAVMLLVGLVAASGVRFSLGASTGSPTEPLLVAALLLLPPAEVVVLVVARRHLRAAARLPAPPHPPGPHAAALRRRVARRRSRADRGAARHRAAVAELGAGADRRARHPGRARLRRLRRPRLARPRHAAAAAAARLGHLLPARRRARPDRAAGRDRRRGRAGRRPARAAADRPARRPRRGAREAHRAHGRPVGRLPRHRAADGRHARARRSPTPAASTRGASSRSCSRSARRSASTRASSAGWSSPRCCTTSASCACRGEIINKTGGLTEEEWEIVRRHPADGQQMLDRVGGMLGEVGPVGARATTSAGTAAATPTACARRRSRSPPASSAPATPSTR